MVNVAPLFQTNERPARTVQFSRLCSRCGSVATVRRMARKDDKLNQLGRMWLFSACTKRDLATIGRASDEVTVPAGRTLTEEGRAGHEFFLILEGQASVRRNGRKVAALGPGQYFGELSLLDRGPRSATVVADTDMRLLVLGQREFNGVLDEVPGMAHKLLRSMAERLRESDAKAYH
jgi:CRP/FNR family cyclic AMP-dependent transcriptional regulator